MYGDTYDKNKEGEYSMVDKKEWKEFRETGLLTFINQILHVFGWALVYEFNLETEEISNVYPARVKFRGFKESSVSTSYEKISKYMVENAEKLYEEAKE